MKNNQQRKKTGRGGIESFAQGLVQSWKDRQIEKQHKIYYVPATPGMCKKSYQQKLS